jgi:hypothetical protein
MKFVRGRKPAPYKLKILTQSAPGYDRGGHAIKVPPPFAKGGVQKPTDLSLTRLSFGTRWCRNSNA